MILRLAGLAAAFSRTKQKEAEPTIKPTPKGPTARLNKGADPDRSEWYKDHPRVGKPKPKSLHPYKR